MTDESLETNSPLPDAGLRLYAGIDELIRTNRFTIAVVVPLVGACVLVASAEGWLPDPLAFNPMLVISGVLIMRAPLINGLVPVLSRRAFLGLGVITAYTYGIEYVGVQTGMPYGDFSYGVTLGPLIGGIPLVLPILFIPLALNAYLLWILVLQRIYANRAIRIGLAIATLVLMDIVLDPAAVALGFWSFADGGGFYAVPLSNYFGWMFSATVAILAIEYALEPATVRTELGRCSYLLDDLVSFVVLWGAINAWFANWIPFIGAVILATVLVIGKHNHDSSGGRRYPGS